MYTIILNLGLVVRDVDKKVVSPCQSTEDPDFIEYNNWINSGNSPLTYDACPEGFEYIMDGVLYTYTLDVNV